MKKVWRNIVRALGLSKESRPVTASDKMNPERIIDQAVKKIVDDYGQTLRWLGSKDGS